MLDIKELDEITFKTKHTNINIGRTNELLELLENNPKKLNSGDPASMIENLDQLIKQKRNELTMFAIIITHCYSMTEVNRSRILSRLPRKDSQSKTDFSRIKNVYSKLNEYGINHSEVTDSVVAEEFRIFSNAIKHGFHNNENNFYCREKECHIQFDALKKLYFGKAQLLNTYLMDLYEKTLPYCPQNTSDINK